MPLPLTNVERELRHTRRVRYEGYKRADGLWDIEAHLTDIKNHDFNLKTGVRRAGLPVHEMWLRITIDKSLTILDASASSDTVPYPGGCESIAPAYRKLIGLNLARGFRKSVKELLGGTRGCTHLVELLGPIATTAFQTIYPVRAKMEKHAPPSHKPGLINTCHAYADNGPIVKERWPQYYTGKE